MSDYVSRRGAPSVDLTQHAFVFIGEPVRSHVHMAHAREIDPLCACPCDSPSMRRKAGDTLCRCPCHGLGPRFTESLCGQEPYVKWTVLGSKRKGRKPTCQACHAYACKPPPPPPPKCGMCCPHLMTRTPVKCVKELVRGEHSGYHQGEFSGKVYTW